MKSPPQRHKRSNKGQTIYETPLARLRQIVSAVSLPVSCPAFARSLGLNVHSVEKMEQGRLKLNSQCLRRIRLVFGAVWDPESKDWKDSGNNRYTVGSCRRWDSINQSAAERWEQLAKMELENVLVLYAFIRTHASKVCLFSDMLAEALQTIIKDTGLEWSLEMYLKSDAREVYQGRKGTLVERDRIEKFIAGLVKLKYPQ